MRIAAIVVGTDDERFGAVDANRERMRLAERIARFAKSAADVVLLPAGFLAAKSDRDVKRHAQSLAEVFGEQVLLAGLDEIELLPTPVQRAHRSLPQGRRLVLHRRTR